MATTSSSQSSWQPQQHEVVRKCERSGARLNAGLKRPRAQKPVFSRVKWLPRSSKEGLCFPLSTKSAQDCSENSISYKNGLKKKTVGRGALLEDEVDKRRTRL